MLFARRLVTSSPTKQLLRELFGVEGLQIVRLLAEADEFDGQGELLLDRHHHAAFDRENLAASTEFSRRQVKSRKMNELQA